MTNRERAAVEAERYLHMDHDCRALGIMNCPIHSAELHEGGEVAVIEFQYPEWTHEEFMQKRQAGEGPSSRIIEVGLMAVRAADSIRVHYDFKRDGYVITQASRFTFEENEPIDMDWQEVAFVRAWTRDADPEDKP